LSLVEGVRYCPDAPGHDDLATPQEVLEVGCGECKKIGTLAARRAIDAGAQRVEVCMTASDDPEEHVFLRVDGVLVFPAEDAGMSPRRLPGPFVALLVWEAPALAAPPFSSLRYSGGSGVAMQHQNTVFVADHKGGWQARAQGKGYQGRKTAAGASAADWPVGTYVMPRQSISLYDKPGGSTVQAVANPGKRFRIVEAGTMGGNIWIHVTNADNTRGWQRAAYFTKTSGTASAATSGTPQPGTPQPGTQAWLNWLHNSQSKDPTGATWDPTLRAQAIAAGYLGGSGAAPTPPVGTAPAAGSQLQVFSGHAWRVFSNGQQVDLGQFLGNGPNGQPQAAQNGSVWNLNSDGTVTYYGPYAQPAAPPAPPTAYYPPSAPTAYYPPSAPTAYYPPSAPPPVYPTYASQPAAPYGYDPNTGAPLLYPPIYGPGSAPPPMPVSYGTMGYDPSQALATGAAYGAALAAQQTAAQQAAYGYGGGVDLSSLLGGGASVGGLDPLTASLLAGGGGGFDSSSLGGYDPSQLLGGGSVGGGIPDAAYF
jgi:hypothetical protein